MKALVYGLIMMALIAVLAVGCQGEQIHQNVPTSSTGAVEPYKVEHFPFTGDTELHRNVDGATRISCSLSSNQNCSEVETIITV